ncbi:MAG: hypothetical protein RLZZ139_2785 [Cyanobacteriota bacterium]|jgi:hypothetical protein
MRVIADIPDVLYQQLESFAQREQIPIDGLYQITKERQQIGHPVWNLYRQEKQLQI